jgi:uncharacterized glyoxalase superfamily protein PhnB
MIAQTTAPVFQVASVDAAIAYYKDVLEFEEDFRVGDYAGMKLGKIRVHLTAHREGEYAKPIGGALFMFSAMRWMATLPRQASGGPELNMPRTTPITE